MRPLPFQPAWSCAVHGAGQVAPDWRRLAVLEAGTGGGLSDGLARSCPGYTGSLFFADVPRGDAVESIRSEDREHLTFDDGSFDVVVTQDVLEHVFQPELAFVEIARVLRRGGLHVFTVPYDPTRVTSRTRARMGPSGVEHLQPPAFHDDLLNPDGVLVATDWGCDLPARIHDSSSLTTEIVDVLDARQGIREPIQIFTSRHAAQPVM